MRRTVWHCLPLKKLVREVGLEGSFKANLKPDFTGPANMFRGND